MKPMFTGLVGAAFLAMTAAAHADCAADLAKMTEGTAHGEGISKDGSLAPLEGAADAGAAATGATDTTAASSGMATGANDTAASTDTAASPDASSGTDTAAAAPDMPSGEGIAKDGSHAPMEGADGQQPGVAMSGADAQAQQDGQPTAAEQAAGDTGSSAGGGMDRETHLQQARAALDAGDEAACMKHLEEAKAAS